MKTHKTLQYTLTAIIPLIILLTSFRMLVFNTQFYYDEMDSNKAYDNIDEDQAKQLTNQVINFLKKGEPITSKAFTNDELKHLEDVRTLTTKTITTLYLLTALAALLTITLIIKKREEAIPASALQGGIITIAIILTIMTASLLAFDKAFILFHKALFNNSLWLLPAESTLIKLLPEQFFIDFTRRLGLYSLAISLLSIIISRLKK